MNTLGHLSKLTYLLMFLLVTAAMAYMLYHASAVALMQCRSRGLRAMIWPGTTDLPTSRSAASIVHQNKMRRGITVLFVAWIVGAGSFATGSLAGDWNLPVTAASADVIKTWWSETWRQPRIDD